MSKPELGTKRLCAGCAAKFYDLHKTPIVCPTCEAVFVPPKPAPARGRRPLEPIATIAPVMAAPASVPERAPVGDAESEAESEETAVAGDNADGEKEADVGVPLLEELDED